MLEWTLLGGAVWIGFLILAFAGRVVIHTWRETSDVDALDDYNQHGIIPPLTEHEHEKRNRRSIFQ